tara:strand:+ start:4802 stop:4933 length:132 start_codon:yes stop_codon:yes gene_type:complete
MKRFLKKIISLFKPFSSNFEKDLKQELEKEKKEQLKRDRFRKS